jgi:hypothetical protein
MTISDLCFRGQGFIGQHGKETKTSWDTLSYTLIQSHNVYQHIHSVQEANRRYEQGVIPKMLMNDTFERIRFSELVDEIFSLNDRQKSLELVEKHSKFWMQMRSGSQGFSGKKTVNAMTMFNQLFEEDTTTVDTIIDDEELDSDDAIHEALGE